MTGMGKPRKLRYLSFFICIVIFLLTQAAIGESVNVVSAPLTTLSTTTNGMVRVYLSSLGYPNTFNLTVNGSYSINGLASQALSNGEKVTVNFNPGTGVYTLVKGGTTLNMGKEFVLRRHNTSGTNGIQIAESNNPSNPYPGDLRFTSDMGSIQYRPFVIANIFIETYLYGVLPYEMGNSAHIEALKAQAVAARTYTLKKMQSRSGSLYDVVDTTNDQVYRGTPSGNANCKAAVDGTKGIVVTNGGGLTGTYYTASNGGQTESSKNIWGGSGYEYLSVKDDPFDLANPDSVKKTATVYGDGTSGSQNASLMALLTSKAAAKVKSMGYQGTTSVVKVLKVNSITPHTPKYGEPSRLYTKMDFGLTVRTLTNAGSTVEVAATVTCDIFSELESMLGMSISLSQNELWTVTKSNSNFILAARRYGHGVGLSQRGAMQMGRLGYTYDQILGFYYGGCKRIQHNFTNTILSAISSGTPQEETTVETPADLDQSDAPATAVVELVNASDLLGIRASASLTAAVIGGVPHGVPVEVWAVNGDWSFIQYGGIKGYVQTSALNISGTAPETTDKTPTQVSGYAVVTASNYLNLRAEGIAGATIVGTAPSGAILSVFSKANQWAYIQYGAIIAYASTDFLSFSDTYPAKTSDPVNNNAVVTLPGGTGTVNMRSSASTNAEVLKTLNHGTNVTVLRNDGTWCRVQYQSTVGYIVSDYLVFTGEPGDPTEEEPPLGEGEVEAVVSGTSGSLNLRETPSLEGTILLNIPEGESVVVTEKGDPFCAVRYEGVSGFAMKQYLVFAGEELPEEEPVITAKAQVTTQSGSLNMRTQGKTGSTILCTIPQYTVIDVITKGDTWSRVKYAGYDGYVMTSFLTFITDANTPAPTQDPNTNLAQVTTLSGSLNLRKSASSGATILTTIPKGEKVTVLEKGSTWCKVIYLGKTGYVMTQYLTFLEPTPTPSPTPTPTPTPDPSVSTEPPAQSTTPPPTATPAPSTAIVNTQSGSLNLRATQGGSIIGRIPMAATVSVQEKGDTWSKVTYGGQTGYVMTVYLKFPSDGTPTPVPGTITVAYVNTTSGSLNLRSEGKPGAQILSRIPQYAEVNLLEKGVTWSKVSYGGQTGYVMTSYLGFRSVTPTPTPPPSSTPTPTPTPSDSQGGSTPSPSPSASIAPTATPEPLAWVNTSSGSLNLRESAVSGSRILLTIPQYSRVTLLEKGTSWCKVAYGGKTGYVMSQYLAFTEAPPSGDGSTQNAWVYTSSGSLNLRLKPDSSANIVCTIPRLSPVTVYSKGSTWSNVSYNGMTGYAMTKYLAFLKPTELAAAAVASPAADNTVTGGTGDTAQTDTSSSTPAQQTDTTPPALTETDTTEQAPAANPEVSLPEQPVLDPTMVSVENEVAIINPVNSSLNLREACSETATLIMEMPKGETLTVTMRGETWCKVRYLDKEGYCMTQYMIFPNDE